MIAVDISVVVPVYNPGANIDDLLASLDAQTLEAGRWEAILVDDGSTDGTGERLDAWATSRPWARVEHIPNSGWPGRPRNVGTDAARGDYVLYVDNDDYLDPEALERLRDRARADDADVVVGKVVGHGKHVPRELFRRNRSEVTLAWAPLVRLLSPHKLFRRALLIDHGIRFPEGRQRLEDHVVVMQAFFRAQRISILADHPIYHWTRRESGNQSFSQMDPAAYFGHDVPAVLDVLDAHTEPGEHRDELYVHWYRTKLLNRLQGGAYARREDAFNRRLYDAVRALLLERFPERLDARLPFSWRVLAQLVRADRFDALRLLAQYELDLKARLRLLERVPREEGGETLRFAGRFGGPHLELRRDGERLAWAPPAALAAALDGIDLEVTDEAKPHTDVLLRHRGTGVEHVLPSKRSLRLDETDVDDVVRPVIRCLATLDPPTAGSGAPLAPGSYEVGVQLRLLGFTVHAFRVRPVLEGDVLGEPERVLVRVDEPPRGLRGRLQRLRRVSR